MYTNANFQLSVRKQTRIALILNETMFFFNLPDKCSCQRPGDVLRLRMASRTLHTTRLQFVRIFGFQPQVVVRTAVRLHGLRR